MIGDIEIVNTPAAARVAGARIEGGHEGLGASRAMGSVHAALARVRAVLARASARRVSVGRPARRRERRARIDWDAIAAVVTDVERMD